MDWAIRTLLCQLDFPATTVAADDVSLTFLAGCQIRRLSTNSGIAEQIQSRLPNDLVFSGEQPSEARRMIVSCNTMLCGPLAQVIQYCILGAGPR